MKQIKNLMWDGRKTVGKIGLISEGSAHRPLRQSFCSSNVSVVAKRKVWWKFFWGRTFTKGFRDSSSKAVNLLPEGETGRKAFGYVSIGILMLGGNTKTQLEGAFEMWKRASVIWSCNVFLLALPRGWIFSIFFYLIPTVFFRPNKPLWPVVLFRKHPIQISVLCLSLFRSNVGVIF